MNNHKELRRFLIRQTDVETLFVNKLGLNIGIGSILYGQFGNKGADTDIQNVYGNLLGDGDFLQAARIIAQPDLYVLMRSAGTAGLLETRLHWKKSEGDYVVLTEWGNDDSLILSVFEDYRQYLGMLLQNYIESGAEPSTNFFPPEASLEEYLFVLHAVDAFRRVSYQNTLDHIFVERTFISFSTFLQSMAGSIQSLDIRWLLSAFLAVVPGVEQYHIEIDPKALALLLEYDFFEQGKLASGEEVLFFGDSGQVAGVEFLRSWFSSWGFEIGIARSNKIEVIERIFIAPTVLAIHFASLKETANGKALVDHKAYSFDETEIEFAKIFKKAFEMDYTSIPEKVASVPEQKAAMTASEPKQKFCINCGTALIAGAAFCKNCGTQAR